MIIIIIIIIDLSDEIKHLYISPFLYHNTTCLGTSTPAFPINRSTEPSSSKPHNLCYISPRPSQLGQSQWRWCNTNFVSLDTTYTCKAFFYPKAGYVTGYTTNPARRKSATWQRQVLLVLNDNQARAAADVASSAATAVRQMEANVTHLTRRQLGVINGSRYRKRLARIDSDVWIRKTWAKERRSKLCVTLSTITSLSKRN
jgi:hypothetical protein